MARVQLMLPDDDQARFAHQARRECMSLNAWLRAAARERYERQSQPGRFESEADLDAFLNAFCARCATLGGPDIEPDWEQHRVVIDRGRGCSPVGVSVRDPAGDEPKRAAAACRMPLSVA